MTTLGFVSKDQRGSKSEWIIPKRSMIYSYTGDYNIIVLWAGCTYILIGAISLSKPNTTN